MILYIYNSFNRQIKIKINIMSPGTRGIQTFPGPPVGEGVLHSTTHPEIHSQGPDMGVRWLQPKGLKGQKNGSRRSSSPAEGFGLPTTLAVSGSVGKQPHLLSLRVFFCFLFLSICLFIYLWLCWIFVSVRGLSPVASSGGHSSSRCAGLSLSRPLWLRSTSSRRAGSVVVAHGPSCSAARGILPDQGSNPCPLHWQADSKPLHHQGSPEPPFLNRNFCSGPREGGRSVCHTFAGVRAGSLRYIRQGCGSGLSETRAQTRAAGTLPAAPLPPPTPAPSAAANHGSCEPLAEGARLGALAWSRFPRQPQLFMGDPATQRPPETRKSPPGGRG